MTSYEYGRALVYIAEQIIKTFGKDFGWQVLKQESDEPYIKDEKTRKAVRAWAEANDIKKVSYYKSSHFWYLRAFNDHEQAIDFWLSYDAEPGMVENKCYTITELCGKEKENV